MGGKDTGQSEVKTEGEVSRRRTAGAETELSSQNWQSCDRAGITAVFRLHEAALKRTQRGGLKRRRIP